MRLRDLALGLTLLTLTLGARADEIYTVTVHNVDAFTGVLTMSGTYTFAEPTIVTSDTIADSSMLLSSVGDPLIYLQIQPLNQDCGPRINPPPGPTGNVESCIFYLLGNGDEGGQDYLGLLTHEGFYPGSLVDLNIAPLPSTLTPEPSCFVLLGSGLLVAAGRVRCRR